MLSIRLCSVIFTSEGLLTVTVKVTLPPGSLTCEGFAVLVTTMLPGGTWIWVTSMVLQRHFEGAPGKASSGLVHRSLAPGCRQLRQFGRSRKPSLSVSTQATVTLFMLVKIGLWALSMSPQRSPP